MQGDNPRKSFDTFYSEIFGPRWEQLSRALTGKGRYHELGPPLLKPYFLDFGSFLAASSLPLSEEEEVLDMCAAPGGKSLVLATRLSEGSVLTANEKSRERRARLHKVLREHLPENLFSRIRVTGFDAVRWGLYEQHRYGKILLDVPCSSERHIVNSPSHLKKWSPARTKNLSVQAYALLSSAFTALKPGGMILYSTCALSPLENDKIIQKLLKRKAGLVRVVQPENGIGEKTEAGKIILPDRSEGAGPAYFSLVQKCEG